MKLESQQTQQCTFIVLNRCKRKLDILLTNSHDSSEKFNLNADVHNSVVWWRYSATQHSALRKSMPSLVWTASFKSSGSWRPMKVGRQTTGGARRRPLWSGRQSSIKLKVGLHLQMDVIFHHMDVGCRLISGMWTYISVLRYMKRGFTVIGVRQGSCMAKNVHFCLYLEHYGALFRWFLCRRYMQDARAMYAGNTSSQRPPVRTSRLSTPCHRLHRNNDATSAHTRWIFSRKLRGHCTIGGYLKSYLLLQS